MPLNQQTAGFPPISQPERTWENSLAPFLQQMYRPEAVAGGGGLVLSVPPTGLTPLLTDGYLVDGDRLVGPFGEDLIVAAPANTERARLLYGLRGLFYGGNAAPNIEAPPDLLVGEVWTNASHVYLTTQYVIQRPGVLTIRSFVDLGKLPAPRRNANFVIGSLVEPAGYRYARVYGGFVRIATALTGPGVGDALTVRFGGNVTANTTIASLDATALAGAANAITANNASPILPPTDTTLNLSLELTDANASITAGVVEINTLIELV